jgi:hypothetical protein
VRIPVLLIVGGLGACTSKVNWNVEKLSTCVSLAACKAHDGERVHVLGVYSVWEPMPTRPDGYPPSRQVMLKFGANDDAEGLFLGAWGYGDHMRPLAEISRHRGKKVLVTGRFLSSMPPHPTDPPEAASVNGPCIHPIERLDTAD